ncbi:TPA: hypothetical protein OT813_002406 [Staphylococcus aureus]|nr:YopX family protein [Staphylococcus aureus]HCT7700312.1 hypothetical protein [Staphylococcus aureus]HCU8139429.1 hypothetical protein [Staphylococcus aureus]HDJ4914173.1 hypothetical protein [Staphylococcus aureus]HDX3369991.1 hypothetical protein [Staphylococcus aureus]
MIPKFRAWDKLGKEMHKVSAIDFSSKGARIIRLAGVQSNGKGDHKRWHSSVELMQSTGLKDVYGKEIYDGDIAEFKYPHDKRFKEIGIITHSAEKACFVIKMIRDTIQEFELYRGVANSYLKVIGNKFDNPELLEESE